jgi:glutathionylspermidine synthase
MRRVASDPRPNWQKRVEEYGFHFHTLKGEPYWDESVCYQLSRHEVDQLEAATDSLHTMCLELVQDVISNRQLGLFLVPPEFEEFVIRSWEEQEPSIYGRFDLAYDGVGPPKMLEYNADTPTALYEAAVIQWLWLKDVEGENGDQFNSIHEQLIEAWQALHERDPSPIHFAAMASVVEDYTTVEYLRDTCTQAGFETYYLDVEAIGWDVASRRFADMAGRPIQRMFKLYPWEFMVREEYGRNVLESPTKWIEPAWKMILSCKSILPMLYQKFPDSPFLLPAFFTEEEMVQVSNSYVRKPIHAREGANIQVYINGRLERETEGPYSGPFVYQALGPVKAFSDRFPVFGSWVVNGLGCGIGIREDDSIVTTNFSRFIPHQMGD